MRHSTAFIATLFLMSNLASSSVTAQNTPVASASKAPQKLPAEAARKIAHYRNKTANARHIYEATVKSEQAHLEKTLRRDLLTATKRGDFAGAQAILAAMKDLHTGVVLTTRLGPLRYSFLAHFDTRDWPTYGAEIESVVVASFL